MASVSVRIMGRVRSHKVSIYVRSKIWVRQVIFRGLELEVVLEFGVMVRS